MRELRAQFRSEEVLTPAVTSGFLKQHAAEEGECWYGTYGKDEEGFREVVPHFAVVGYYKNTEDKIVYIQVQVLNRSKADHSDIFLYASELTEEDAQSLGFKSEMQNQRVLTVDEVYGIMNRLTEEAKWNLVA